MPGQSKSPKGLGRGISALMGDIGLEQAVGAEPDRPADRVLPIEQIAPNPDQPRRHFAEEALEDLAASIRAKGILQPLIVRPVTGQEAPYQIVAGERRWRAAQRAKLHDVPVLIRSLEDAEVLEIAIIENIQRENLNPIEEAQGYRQLIETYRHSQEELAQLLGRSRSLIANSMRLLTLPDDVQAHVEEGRLSSGHARALVTASNASDLARVVISKGLSVRQTERLAKSAKPGKEGGDPGRKPEKDSDTKAIEQDLAANLRMGVSINHKDIDGAGEVVIRYRSLEQLDVLCQMLSAMPPDESI